MKRLFSLSAATSKPKHFLFHFRPENHEAINRSTDHLILDDLAEQVEAGLTTGASLAQLKQAVGDDLTITTVSSSLKLRDDHGDQIDSLARGSSVKFLNDVKITRDANGQVPIGDTDMKDGLINPHVWFKVEMASGKTGWASAEYLKGGFNLPPTTTTTPPPSNGVPNTTGGNTGTGVPNTTGGNGTPTTTTQGVTPSNVVTASFLNSQLRANTEVMGEVNANQGVLPASNAVMPQVVSYVDQDNSDALAEFGQIDMATLSPAQQAALQAELTTLNSNPQAFEDFMNTEPILTQVLDGFVEAQADQLQLEMFASYLQVTGLSDAQMSTLLPPLADYMVNNGLNLAAAVTASGIPTTHPFAAVQSQIAQLHNGFNNHPAFNLVAPSGTDRLDQLQNLRQDQLLAMARLARTNGQNNLAMFSNNEAANDMFATAEQIYQELLADKTQNTVAPQAVEDQITEAQNDIAQEITAAEVLRALQDQGLNVNNTTDPEVVMARQNAIDQAQGKARLHLLITEGVLSTSDPIVAEYKDMMGLDVGFWDFDWADQTKYTIAEEAIITAVIGVATMGTGLLVGGVARGAFAMARGTGLAARGIRGVAYVGGAQTGYAASFAGFAEGDYWDNASDAFFDGKVLLANAVGMGMGRALVSNRALKMMQGGSLASTALRTGGVITGASALETAAMSGVDVTDPNWARQFFMATVMNSVGIRGRNIPGQIEARTPNISGAVSPYVSGALRSTTSAAKTVGNGTGALAKSAALGVKNNAPNLRSAAANMQSRAFRTRHRINGEVRDQSTYRLGDYDNGVRHQHLQSTEIATGLPAPGLTGVQQKISMRLDPNSGNLRVGNNTITPGSPEITVRVPGTTEQFIVRNIAGADTGFTVMRQAIPPNRLSQFTTRPMTSGESFIFNTARGKRGGTIGNSKFETIGRRGDTLQVELKNNTTETIPVGHTRSGLELKDGSIVTISHTRKGQFEVTVTKDSALLLTTPAAANTNGAANSPAAPTAAGGGTAAPATAATTTKAPRVAKAPVLRDAVAPRGGIRFDQDSPGTTLIMREKGRDTLFTKRMIADKNYPVKGFDDGSVVEVRGGGVMKREGGDLVVINRNQREVARLKADAETFEFTLNGDNIRLVRHNGDNFTISYRP